MAASQSPPREQQRSNDVSEKLIRELSEAEGVSGYETSVAKLFRKHLKKLAPVEADAMGNLVGRLEGTAAHPRVMLCAHLDEIGLVTQAIGPDGRIHFLCHGGWWKAVMLQQPVNIRTARGLVPGIVSSTSSFFLPMEELSSYEAKTSMFVDIGASSKQEAEEELGVRIGDPIILDAPFRRMANPNLFSGKAFDDRLGLAALLDVARELAHDKAHPNTLLLAASVQEEIGGRGAEAVTRFCQPDVAIVVEGPPADDLPLRPERSQCILGRGVHLRKIEPGLVSNGPLYRLVVETARKLDIPHQEAVCLLGGSDGAHIHTVGHGTPCLMLGVPVRYAHAHHGLFHMGDYRQTVKLLTAVVRRLDAAALDAIRDCPYA
jgi:endoglucanase